MIAYSMKDGLTISAKVPGDYSLMYKAGDVFRLPDDLQALYFEGLSAEGSKKKQEKLRGLFLFRKATVSEIVEGIRKGQLKREDLDKAERKGVMEFIKEKVKVKVEKIEAEIEKGSSFFD